MKLKGEMIKIHKITENENTLPASYLDLDRVLFIDMFDEDGVHLNLAGTLQVEK